MFNKPFTVYMMNLIFVSCAVLTRKFDGNIEFLLLMIAMILSLGFASIIYHLSSISERVPSLTDMEHMTRHDAKRTP